MDGEEAVVRAHGFWLYAEGYAKTLGTPLTPQSRALDVGCGWGRITRLFSRDIASENIHGIDIDPHAIALCETLGVPGNFTLTKPNEPLPFEDNSFDVITAYSVFTHLPEDVATGLAAELSRVAAPGCVIVFTVEDKTFLDVFDMPNFREFGGRWEMLAKYADEAPSLRMKYDDGEFLYLVTNNEGARTSAVYGDALISEKWMRKNWNDLFEIVAMDEAKPPVYQGVVVARKT